MNRNMLLGIGISLMLAMGSISVSAESADPAQEAAVIENAPIMTRDGLVKIKLPDTEWYQVTSEEYTEMFSDGDSAILINLYKNGDELPAVKTADENHEMIYTAAASTLDYVLYVTGYAHNKSDFSGICSSINSIAIDPEKITETMLNHTITVSEYAVVDVNYDAWVSVEGLNVRSDSAKTASILTCIGKGTKVSVIGTVTRNGEEIGWVRVRLADGSEGYVSAQFLNTTEVKKEEAKSSESKEAAKTGATMTLYTGSGAAYTLYEYTDGRWKTENGTEYWKATDFDWINAAGGVLYVNKPDDFVYRTGWTKTLYYGHGVYTIIYYYSDDTWRDDDGIYFHEKGDGNWESEYGDTFYPFDDEEVVDDGSDEGDEACEDEQETVVVSSEEGDVRYLRFIGSDVWYDQYDVTFWRSGDGVWLSEEDIYYYE